MQLVVTDALGRVVRTLVSDMHPAGLHGIPFDAAGMPAGMYHALLRWKNRSAVVQMVLMR